MLMQELLPFLRLRLFKLEVEVSALTLCGFFVALRVALFKSLWSLLLKHSQQLKSSFKVFQVLLIIVESLIWAAVNAPTVLRPAIFKLVLNSLQLQGILIPAKLKRRCNHMNWIYRKSRCLRGYMDTICESTLKLRPLFARNVLSAFLERLIKH